MNRHVPFLALVLAACGTPTPEEEIVSTDKVKGESGDFTQTEREIAWSAADDPSLFTDDLVYVLDQLPQTGSAEVAPWAGNYWPTWQDNINYRWDGANSDAPATKYGAAYGVNGIEDAVSRHHGIDANSSRKACTSNSDCDPEMGEACAKREGNEDGRCIPTWWGICHAWAPASILYREPQQPVTRNGVTFKVNDIKALLTLATENVSVKFVSRRCNDDEGRGQITYDEYGRPDPDGSCIDTNPATYHLLLANYLGLRQQSFVEDRTFDDEVWNQPLRGYRVTKLEAIDAATANGLVGVQAEGGASEEASGVAAAREWTHFGPFDLAEGAKVTATMTGQNDADLYVRLGAQPTTSTYDCRPYSSSSNETCEVTGDGTQAYVSVRGYAASSDFELSVTAGGALPAGYLFNPQAARFYHVKTEVDYIAESAASTDGNLASTIDRYTHTDRYEYVLEADDAGRLLGGEWIGASKRNHPDFLWLPTAAPSSARIAGGKIKLSDVVSLWQDSLIEEEATNGPTVTGASGDLERGAWKHYGPFDTAAGTQLTASITGTGDADLYVRRGAKPSTRSYDCRPYKNGSVESCEVAGGGPVFVSVRGYSQSTFELSVTYTSAGDGEAEDEAEPVEVVHLDESGDLAPNEWAHFTVNAEAGRRLVLRVTAPNDVDLYVRMGSAPTLSRYDHRPYTGSGNETVSFVPDADGVVHVAVHGYAASSFTLTSADD